MVELSKEEMELAMMLIREESWTVEDMIDKEEDEVSKKALQKQYDMMVVIVDKLKKALKD